MRFNFIPWVAAIYYAGLGLANKSIFVYVIDCIVDPRIRAKPYVSTKGLTKDQHEV